MSFWLLIFYFSHVLVWMFVQNSDEGGHSSIVSKMKLAIHSSEFVFVFSGSYSGFFTRVF